MKHTVVAVFDKQLNAYMRPWTVPTAGTANRAFSDEVNRKESEMFKHPEDYALHELGIWDDADGQFVSYEKPRHLAEAANVITKE